VSFLERRLPRVYQWVKPRSVLLHLVFLIIAAGCGTAAWWQVSRAAEGNTLSYLYSVEWPAFIVVAGIGWWQMVHDTPDDIAHRQEFHRRMRQASAEVVARTLPRSATALTVGSEDVGGRVLGPAERRSLPAGGAEPGSDPGSGLVPAGGPGEMEAMLLARVAEDDAPGDEMTEYNRYLALLAVKGKAKTWRNPRGV
jgi:hypothetical protein